MTNLITLICSILITIFVTVSARKEIEGETIKFFSEKDLRVFIKEKDHFDGVCRRKIQFTYGVGPTQPTQDNVYVPCYDNYDEKNDGNKYVITHILYSENPQTVIIITPKGTCEKYHNNGGTLAGPQTINGIQCVKIKLKTRGGVVGSMMSILHMMNPSNISGNSNISGSNVSGSELSGLSKVLRDEFRTEPKDTRSALGEKVLLQCGPPRGTPEPVVHWRRNGEQINLEIFDRMRIVDGGNLQISNVQLSDAGKYQCVAQNLVGIRYSDIITLTVHKKPYLISAPRDVVTVAGESVEFECGVAGEPQPRVLWRRHDGRMPVGRAHVLDDRTLRIEQTQPGDEGEYICDAENDVGAVTARASLTVHAPPEFVERPQDLKVALNADVRLECIITGNPTPTMFWSREDSHTLMFPGQNYGHIMVQDSGTLEIREVLREDSGYFVCSAVSLAGSASARAYLQVVVKEDPLPPPPLVEVGPTNQTLPLHSPLVLPCQARGPQNLPPPDIQWYKDGFPVGKTSPRTSVWPNGTLFVEDLQQSDSGLFTCTASTNTGESSWTATVVVDPQMEIQNETLDLMPPPPAPAAPQIVNSTQNSLTVVWKPVDSAHISGYTVQYYSPDIQTGWVTVAKGWNSTMLEVSDLRPDTGYMFVVRAEIGDVLSLPSEFSTVTRTLSSDNSPQLQLARTQLSAKPRVLLKHIQAVSSTAITLIWQIPDPQFVEGLYIRYRDETRGSQEFQVSTLLNTDATTHTLTRLRKYSFYQVFIVPFYRSVQGFPSNSMEVQTMEDVPSAPPEHLEIAWVNISSAFIHWSPPPLQHCNGHLLGYELMVQNSHHRPVRTLRLNASAMSVLVNNLTQGHIYTVSLKAFTRIGPGPSAQVQSLRGPDAYRSLVTPQLWLVLTAAVAAVVLVTALVAVFYLRRRTKQISHLSAVNVSDLPRLGLMGGVKEALWIEVPHEHPRKHITLEGSDYAEVDTQHLSSFYGGRDVCSPTPYATTILVPNTRQDSCSETGPLIVPVSSSSSGTKTSTSGDSWLRQEQNKSTLEIREAEKRCQQCSVKETSTNWTAFLPPPPQHPPPPRPQGICGGSPPMSKKSLGTCSHHSRDSNLGLALYAQCWQANQAPSFPSGYHTGSSNNSSCKCHQNAPVCRSQSQDNSLASRHHDHIHRHEHNHCPCCCQMTDKNTHRHIPTVSGDRAWEEASYSSVSCSCSEDTTSCSYCQNKAQDCDVH